VNPYEKGMRVQIHPGSDLWMRGAKFGEVHSVKGEQVKVRMDHPQVKKLASFHHEDLRPAFGGSYVAIVDAAPGTLLPGGMRSHRSSRFASMSMAEDFLEAFCHRLPRNLRVRIVKVPQTPEIY
jgi:hypothetical protein